MSLTNVSKPTTTLANVAKIAQGLTWATITTTWATETETWGGLASSLDNVAKPTTTFTNVAKP